MSLSEANEQLKKAKIRVENQRAIQLELSNGQHEGRLLRKEDVEAAWTEWMVEWRTHVEALPSRLSQQKRLNAVQMAALRKALDGMVKAMGDFTKRQQRLRAQAAKGKETKPVQRNRAAGTGKGRVGRPRKAAAAAAKK